MIDVIVFLGIQGSGKGTQAKLLAEKTGYQHVNIGDLFREQIALGSELGDKVKAIITSGALVSDALVFELVNSALKSQSKGVIFDGFPRTEAQAEFLLEHYHVKRVYYLELSEADAIARIEGRRICQDCGENFHLQNRKPLHPGICDSCGGKLIQRADDAGEAIRKRVGEFYAQTFALKEIFAKQGLLKEISALNTISEVSQAISEDLAVL